MHRIPEVVTHNYHPARGAFRNLCDLPEAEAARLLEEIRAAERPGIKADYLHRRLAVEAWLIAERQKKLGATRLRRPIYFFLGDFADGLDPSRPESFVAPLAAFPPEVLTFTYPDSMASLPLATRDDHAACRQPHHGRVFTLAEIQDLVAREGMPGERWKTEPARRFDRFIEVQIWDERPIRRLLEAGGRPSMAPPAGLGWSSPRSIDSN